MDKIATTPNQVSRIKSLLRPVTTRIPFADVPAAPELSASKLRAVDNAYDEYCDRLEAGEAVDAIAFCERHADYRSALYRCIEVHQFLDENPDTLDYLEPIPWPQIGDEFGDCKLIEELGRGGVGRVYLAQEAELPRCVVLKLAAVNNGEAERICRLNHDYIVPIYYVRRDEETRLTAICMPFESRYTLVDVLDEAFKTSTPPKQLADICRKLFPDEFSDKPDTERDARTNGYVEDVLKIGQNLADALAHSHEKRIYHLDLKPSNVLIKHDGLPMLIDFNMAIDDDHRGEFFGGTKPYMSPEQIYRVLFPLSPDAEDLDGKSDVYSLAIILCQLLTGEHPFGDVALNGTEPELLSRQQEWLPGELERFSHVDRNTIALLAKCLTFEAHLRPTAADLSFQLTDILRRKREAPSRRKLLAGALVAGMGSLVAAWAIGNREPDHVVLYREGLSHVANGRHDDAIKSFTRSTEVDFEYAAAWIARARTREIRGSNGDFSAAVDDYENAYRLSPIPALKASMGYCKAQLKDFGVAITQFHTAIEGGFATAEVFNNLGYCQMELTYFPDAETNLNKALELNPELQAVWYNRALIHLKRNTKRGGPISATAASDIERALETGAEDSRLLYYAALIWDRLPSESPQRAERILELLDRALDLGLDSRLITAGTGFEDFRDDPNFQTIISQSRLPRRVRHAPRLLHPVDLISPKLANAN